MKMAPTFSCARMLGAIGIMGFFNFEGFLNPFGFYHSIITMNGCGLNTECIRDPRHLPEFFSPEREVRSPPSARGSVTHRCGGSHLHRPAVL